MPQPEPVEKLRLDDTLTIPATLHGQRLDAVLANLLPSYSRSQLTQWIKQGQIHCNGKPFKPKDKAEEGALLQLQVSFIPADPDFKNSQPQNIPLSILYEDEALLVLNKAAGLVVHPGAGNREHTLVNALLHHAPGQAALPRAGIIHRLDKDTTGLLVVAKSLEAQTALVRQMQAREIERHYLALVNGEMLQSGRLETGFGRHGRNRLKMAVQVAGKTAITHYQIKKRYRNFTLLDISLHTGRTHQIRVHMQHLHHPLLGDPLYGCLPKLHADTSEMEKAAIKSMKRQALHAARLQFRHPLSGDLMAFTAPLPTDFSHLLTILDEENARYSS